MYFKITTNIKHQFGVWDYFCYKGTPMTSYEEAYVLKHWAHRMYHTLRDVDHKLYVGDS